jgi:hypothetical protein
MNRKLFDVLNQPFVLWFLSSVVIGFVSWQYAEIQKNSAEQQTQERVLRRANLELKLLLQDIESGAKQKENLTIGLLNATLIKMQYNASSPSSQYYVPTLQNVMLEIDSRTGANGLEQYQSKIYKKLEVISNILTREFTTYQQPNQKLWGSLTTSEKESLRELAKLAGEILSYYTKVANKKNQMDL